VSASLDLAVALYQEDTSSLPRMIFLLNCLLAELKELQELRAGCSPTVN
jgi:hypothetical protein